MEYPGLPEALNDGQYLVPRMTRDELRSAITGPVAVAGAEIAPRLVQRLLNDMGSDQDQLPLLQHALMRTWDHWARRRSRGARSTSTTTKAWAGCATRCRATPRRRLPTPSPGREQQLVERMFRALSDIVDRPARRTAAVRGGRDRRDCRGVVRAKSSRPWSWFRRPGRSFLMPPAPVPLTPDTIVDLSHESLMRCWTRLRGWVRGGARRRRRLSAADARGAVVRRRHGGPVARSRAGAGAEVAHRAAAHGGLGRTLRRVVRAGDALPREQRASSATGS